MNKEQVNMKLITSTKASDAPEEEAKEAQKQLSMNQDQNLHRNQYLTQMRYPREQGWNINPGTQYMELSTFKRRHMLQDLELKPHGSEGYEEDQENKTIGRGIIGNYSLTQPVIYLSYFILKNLNKFDSKA